MTTEKDATYNGWTNYETWCVNLWLTNEPGTYDGLSEIVQTPTETVSERADMLKEYVEEVYELPTDGLAADLVRSSLDSVNWHEIVTNHEDEDA